MSEEDIRLALRMVAMGRVNHPLVEQFAAWLAALPSQAAGAVVLPVVEAPQDAIIKRGPGRPRKTD